MKFQRDSIAHPRRPRGGQLGQEKRRWKFSRTGERALGIPLITKQFHDIFECLSVIGAQSEASILTTVSLACAGKLSSRRVFSGNEPPKLLYQFHWGEKFNKLTFKGQKNFFCTYLTSMPSKKKILRFVVFCILAWLSFCLMLLIIRCFRHFLPCTLFSLWLPGDRVSRTDCKTWTEKRAQMDWELKHFCDSHIYKCRSQAEKNGSEGLWKWEISHSLKMICVLF